MTADLTCAELAKQLFKLPRRYTRAAALHLKTVSKRQHTTDLPGGGHMTHLTETRVREIVREELTARTTDELRQDRVDHPIGDAGSPLQPFNPVLQKKRVHDGNSHELHEDFEQLLRGLITVAFSGGASGQQELEDLAARLHARRHLIEHDCEHVVRVIGSDHASPSSVRNTSSVGDGVASGDDLRAHTSDATRPDGGAS